MIQLTIPFPRSHSKPQTPSYEHNSNASINYSSRKTSFTSSQPASPITLFSIQQQTLNEHLVKKGSKSKRVIKPFHQNFNELKSKMNIPNTRKTHIDSLLKKLKSKCLKAVHEVVKSCFDLYVGRLPQSFITNIKIDFNKYYLNKTIGEIYVEFKLLPSYNEIYEKNLIRNGKDELFNDIYNMTFKQVYITYLESTLFKKDYEKIKKKDGNEIAQLFDYVARNMCDYYLFSKGNKKTKLSFHNKKSFTNDNCNNGQFIGQKFRNINVD